MNGYNLILVAVLETGNTLATISDPVGIDSVNLILFLVHPHLYLYEEGLLDRIITELVVILSIINSAATTTTSKQS